MDYTKAIFIIVHILSVFFYLFIINKGSNKDKTTMLEEIVELKTSLDGRREKQYGLEEGLKGLKNDFTQIQTEMAAVIEERLALLEQKKELEPKAMEIMNYELTEQEALEKYKQKEREFTLVPAVEGGN